MAGNILFSILVITGLLLSGCLSEPEGFTCIDGSPLRLVDDRWYCESANPAVPIPVTDSRFYIDANVGLDSNPGSADQRLHSGAVETLLVSGVAVPELLHFCIRP